MDPSVSRIYAPFYSSAFTWNYALGMTQLLIPLYARELGYSGVAIGSLIALPIIVQMVFNLIGAGIFGKTDQDSIEDFKAVYDFQEAFVKPYSPEKKAEVPKSLPAPKVS